MAQNFSQADKRLALYYVVEFLTRGRKSTVKKVDIVLGSWLCFNQKLKKCSTKYPDAPYSELQSYLEACRPAPSTWSSYTVKLRARASTLDEAVMKLNKLNEAESAMTVSSEESLSDVEQAEVELVRRQKFFDDAFAFENSISGLQQSTSNVEQRRDDTNSLVKEVPSTMCLQSSVLETLRCTNVPKEYGASVVHNSISDITNKVDLRIDETNQVDMTKKLKTSKVGCHSPRVSTLKRKFKLKLILKVLQQIL